MRFSNQDFDNFRFKFDRTHLGYAPFLGDDSFIFGGGKDFTVFGPEYEEHDEGISSPYSGFIMVDNGGLSSLVDNGSGRSFKDGDGQAELSTWPGTSKVVPSTSIYKMRQENVGSN